MAEYLIQEESLTAIADAIRDIDGSTNRITPSGMVESLKGVDTEVNTQTDIITEIKEVLMTKASVDIDTSDATATASDIANGKTAYVNGDKITGSLELVADSLFSNNYVTTYNDNLHVVVSPDERAIIDPKYTEIGTYIPLSDFGNATAADVLSGKTFTSADGVCLTGTHECKGILGVGLSEPSEMTITSKTAWAGTQYYWDKTTWQYSDSINVSDGVISLSEPITTKTFNQSSSTPNCSILKGKYVIRDSDDAVYFIPEDATFGQKSLEVLGYTTLLYVCNNAQKVYLSADTSDATAMPEDIANGKTAYVDGVMIIGSHVCGGGTGTSNADTSTSLVDGTMTEYVNSKATKLIEGAFYKHPSITNVSLAACTSIGSSAFYSCNSLTSVNFPVCTDIGSMAFDLCYSLANISFPSCVNIGSLAFRSCAISYANFPRCTTINSNAFIYCKSLTNVSFPSCTTVGSGAFSGCTSLSKVDLPVCTTIGSSAFRGCSKLTNLTIRTSSVAKLSSANAFALTPMSNSTYTGSFGSIYVPSSLVASYKTASYWSTYSSRITSI